MPGSRGLWRRMQQAKMASTPESGSESTAEAANPEQPRYLPYSRQTITDEDVDAVVEVLRSAWLTTGPAVDMFESAMAAYTGAKYAVAVSSGTAALHAAMYALGIGPGDEVVVPPFTFAATANAVVFCGGRPIFADVTPGSLCLDPRAAAAKITSRTRAIIAVDFAGQPCDYEELAAIAQRHSLALVADACHALGAATRNRNVGTLADLSTFSFHPVKHITTGEGGMITTGDARLADRMRMFRNHGIDSDHRQRAERGSFRYEMVDLGFQLPHLGPPVCAGHLAVEEASRSGFDSAGPSPQRTTNTLAGCRGSGPLNGWPTGATPIICM